MAENCMCDKCLCTSHPSTRRVNECKRPRPREDWHGNPDGCTLTHCLCCNAAKNSGVTLSIEECSEFRKLLVWMYGREPVVWTDVYNRLNQALERAGR